MSFSSTGMVIHISGPESNSDIALCGENAERLVSPAFSSMIDHSAICTKCLELLLRSCKRGDHLSGGSGRLV